MKDEIILVNMDDEEIGYGEKMEVHRIPALHRAFSVFLYKIERKEPVFLLQKRAAGKYHSGGLWTNTCCSHPRRGETLSEAVFRRMKEELGIETETRELFSFTYYHRFSENCAEYEYDHVFAGVWDGETDPDPEEIEGMAWIAWSDLEERMMRRPDLFSPWFLIAAPKVADILRKEAGR